MLPTVRGVIDRRILVNYRVEPAVLEEMLPEPFSPQTVNGYGIGGICLIRLRDLRPRGIPAVLGVSSENVAHRIAVEVDDASAAGSSVLIPRRDTDSWLRTTLGSRVFPGVYHRASFAVEETADRYEIRMESDDGDTHVHVVGEPTDSLPEDSVFDTVEEASTFFERGSVGYSPSERADEYERIDLHTFEWDVTPLSVESVSSSYFDALDPDAVTFDHALLMRDVDHEWRAGESLCSVPAES